MGGNVSSTRPHPPPQRIDETYMTQHNLPDIPQEIIDEIIDRCAEDKRTLIACSLTSRTWVYRTRKHLFSKLTLTDETLPIWCGIVATPAKGSRNQPRLVPGSHPPPSSSYAPSWVSFHITSLQLVPKYTPDSKNQLGVYELLQAKSHLSAFINLKSLTLTALVFTTFDDASLKACFGSLAETVSELKLSVCLLDEERFFALARMFTGLESLEVNGNVWNESASVGETESLEKDLPTLRGSFTASQIIGNVGLLESLATAKAEYHTITLGWNHPSTFPKFNALFARSKDHLRTLILTRPEQDVGRSQTDLTLDLSLCGKLVEIQATFAHAEFGTITPILKTITSPRLRKLTFFIIPPLPMANQDWAKLDLEMAALAKRVIPTARNVTLQVLFYSHSTTFGGLKFSDIEAALPRVASDARVSLRVENATPLKLDAPFTTSSRPRDKPRQ